MERKLSIILAADVVGYSALMEKDESGTYDRLKACRDDIFEPAIASRRGRTFKLVGDGSLAEFASVVDAVECSVFIQQALARRNASSPPNERIEVRMGINIGEVIVEGDDLYGEGVNVAARLEQLAPPGGICVSSKVVKEVEKKVGFAFRSLGEQRVKNIAEPVHIYTIDIHGLPRNAARPASRVKYRRALAAALVVASIGGGAFYFLSRPNFEITKSGIPAIAVLPFDNMSGDPKLDSFSDALSEDMIAVLSRAPDVAVVARNSSFIYKGKATDVREIGKALGVGFILEGSVSKDADKVRIVAQLIDADTGNHVWADRIDETGADPLALQDEATTKILDTLVGEKGQLKQAQYRRAWALDAAKLGEYDYYLRGHYEFMKDTKAGFEEATRIGREGLTKFPNSSLLMFGLAFSRVQLFYMGWSSDTAADLRQAGELARKGMSRPDLTTQERRLGEWLLAYVYASEGDFRNSMNSAEAAISLAPRDAFMYADLSQMPIWAGQPDKALEWANFALKSEPDLGPLVYPNIGWAHLLQGDYRGAIAVLKDQTGYSDWVSPCLRAIARVRLGDIDAARDDVKAALAAAPSGFKARTWKALNFARDPAALDQQVADLVKAGMPN